MRLNKPSKLGLIGGVLAGVGAVALAWGNVNDFDPERVGIVLLIMGTILMTFKRLEQKNLAADEIYNVAYERGMEEGYDQGYEDRGQEQPARPVVVPFPVQRCPACGSEAGLVAVSKSGAT
ncbi:hypothetical protein [Streptomyces sp.]|uniref:hypothetical protein n=1 Tax=Streptomyces sp. TaxID=1931 RepID=UPI002F952A20